MNYNNQPMMQGISEESLLARHKVLRQTYILLGMNVLFSAVCAYIGMALHISMPPILYIIGMLGLSFAVMATRNSGAGIILLFAFTGFMGFAVSGLLSAYINAGMGNVVFKALLGTAVIFFSLSSYALISGKNFSFLGGFLFVGFLTVLLCSLGALFFNMTALSVVCSGAFILIFSGYVLYDTSNILHGAQTNYVMATMNLFINIFNIFISLLNLLSAFNRN